jgi:serine/threonine-protein kinase
MSRKREARPDALGVLRRIEELRGDVGRGRARISRPPPSPWAQPNAATTLASTTANGMLPMSMMPVSSSPMTGPRLVAVAPFEGDASHEKGARALSAATADELSRVRGVRVISKASSTRDESLDPVVLGRELSADFVVDGALRVSGDRARVRARVVEVATGLQLWGERFEGSARDALTLEDKVATAVAAALRTRADEGARRGPSDRETRDLFERARAAYAKIGGPAVREAIHLLEQANARSPDDPFILSALGAALTRLWLMQGGSDGELSAQAEEASLRSLASNADIGETFVTIGILRLQQGETASALRAFQEALVRSPLNAEAHAYVGRLLAESGHVDEAARRFELALKLDARTLTVYWDRARISALLGDRAEAEAIIERGVEAFGSELGALFPLARFALYWEDRALAAKMAKLFEEEPAEGAIVRKLTMPTLVAYAQDDATFLEKIDRFEEAIEGLAGSPRQRCFHHQLAAELYGAAKAWDRALASIEKAARLPLVDVLWLDQCPCLGGVREHPRFATARATTAARVAELWG